MARHTPGNGRRRLRRYHQYILCEVATNHGDLAPHLPRLRLFLRAHPNACFVEEGAK